MSRRRSNQPSISLFSFQDIVTSVTAILILIVLILSLELISRKYEAAAGDPAAAKESAAGAVAELETLVNRLAAEASRETDSVAGPALPSIPDSELRTLRDQLERAATQVEDARRIHEKASNLAEESVTMLSREQLQSETVQEEEREAARLAEDAEMLTRENAAERTRLETQQREINGRPLPGPELVFRRPPGTARRSWLLETSDKGFAALQLGTGKSDSLGTDSGDASGLANWIATLEPAADYVLILARPSGIDPSGTAKQRLKAADIPHGIDFIGEDQGVHDGSIEEEPLGTDATPGDRE